MLKVKTICNGYGLEPSKRLKKIAERAFNNGAYAPFMRYQYCDWDDVRYVLKKMGLREKDFKKTFNEQ